ncbi:methyltransferase domain-containing protein [Sulfurovum sp. XGS-02]|uniref:methyltransferase domain-containing protein n=1 Tax=Sulfurovum sp. XGS-02 TaxID=2925411 RepID=UPI00206020F4|nr:methyltransferase domain-containing protein [Sulfurovum sp. XGS-02]UPT77592.1 methyltransferase domain-containing protein [Sulfurovum sp. XGS-02]
MSTVIQEFSRFAHEYDTYNVIQAEVAKALVEQLPPSHYTTLIDIGCGSGEVYKNLVKHDLSFEQVLVLDSSPEMLEIHPSSKKIKKICADFNKLQAFEHLPYRPGNLLLSSSALQWSKDLDFTLSEIAKKSHLAYFAIFTSNTFKTLHETAQIPSPIYPESVLRETIEKYYRATFEVKKYKLHFESVREMFNYIKKSGVSGGEKQLCYRETKQLMKRYPLDYLEFEVLFVKATSLAHPAV